MGQKQIEAVGNAADKGGLRNGRTEEVGQTAA